MKQRWLHRSCLLSPVAALLFVAVAPAQALEIGSPDNSAAARIAEAVLRPAYAKAGIELKLAPMPLRRSLNMADRGSTDGELMRTAEVLNELPQLLRIDVPVVRVVISAYRRGDCPARFNPAELGAERVAYFRGTRMIERLLPATAMVPADDTWDALRRLQAGAVDLAMGIEIESDALLLANGVSGVCKIAEPVVTAPLYHSLNQRHTAQASRLEQTLKSMQAQGEIARIWASEEKRIRDEATRRAGLSTR